VLVDRLVEVSLFSARVGLGEVDVEYPFAAVPGMPMLDVPELSEAGLKLSL